jgi:hypothetical protein
MDAPYKICKCIRCGAYYSLYVKAEWWGDMDKCPKCNDAMGTNKIPRKIRLWDLMGE